MSSVNIVIYLKENVNKEKENLKNFRLLNLIQSIGVSEGRIEEIDSDAVAIYETNNFDAARIKSIISKKLFNVETFVEMHHRIHKHITKPIH
ncbi:MAG: hypothetical protein NZZ41_01645 [Candidatus Dojkabacteria bacterium]|nr:hypothetical protein [Candidatus Dojkabacteria bacterium]